MEEKNRVVGRIVKAIMIWLITIAIMMLSFELVVEMGASHWGNGVENARLDKLGVVICTLP